MSAQSRRDESPREDGDDLDEGQDDAAALRAMISRARVVGALAPGEEATLLQRAALGDNASQDRLVAAHLDLVIRLAAERGEQGLSVPDLVQEGAIGLLQAVRSFADSGEGDFARFAAPRIAAQMDAAIATEAAAVREGELLVVAATDYERVELLMRRELHREPTAAELAEKLEWTLDRTLYVARIVDDARRRYDEELLAFIDPEALDLDDDDERSELDG
ncbi:MAG TPA: sigma factor [Candidatus Dormibacteraeota bacterium]|nr:sigma factor [Candidatus Dormibacteraeota bacterium]